MNVDFQRKVDRYAGVPLCHLLSLLPGTRRSVPPTFVPKRILVILLSEMGSLVLAHSMFSRMRQMYPEASLHALVFEQNKEVLELLDVMPNENILTIRNRSAGVFASDCLHAIRHMRRLGIDTVIDCELFSRASGILSFLSGATLRAGFHPHTQEGLYRGDFINRPVLYNPYQHMAHQFVTLAEALEAEGAPRVKRLPDAGELRVPVLELRSGELDAMHRRFESDFPMAKGRRVVLLYAGGGLLPVRAWPQEKFVQLAASLLQDGFAVGLTGLASDRPLTQSIGGQLNNELCLDLAGYTRTVRELMLLFHLSDLLVTNDGGPGHFASMTPIPTIIFYGPETPLLYGSLGAKQRSAHFYTALSCSPCLTAYNHRDSPCDGDNQCLKRIEVAEVLAKSRELIREAR